MKPGIIVAIVASIILVGGATFTRLSKSNQDSNSLSLVKNDEQLLQDSLLNFLKSDTAAPVSTSTGPLTGTELISRQLVMEYLDLATNKQATDENIDALTNRFIESIPTLSSSRIVAYNEIKVVDSNTTNFQKYTADITQVYRTYASTISRVNSQATSFESLSPSTKASTLAFSNAYKDAAVKLKSMPVPSLLVPTHLKLVNSFFSSAEAMAAISNVDKDSATAFAGLVTLNKNIRVEKDLFIELDRLLIASDI